MRCEHCHLAEATGHFRHCPKWTPDTHAEVESHVDRLVRWAEEADNAGFYEYAWKFSEAANHIESLNSENTRLRNWANTLEATMRAQGVCLCTFAQKTVGDGCQVCEPPPLPPPPGDEQ